MACRRSEVRGISPPHWARQARRGCTSSTGWQRTLACAQAFLPPTRLLRIQLLDWIFPVPNQNLDEDRWAEMGRSGLRVGVLASRNRELLDAHTNLGYFAMIPGTTQAQVAEILREVSVID